MQRREELQVGGECVRADVQMEQWGIIEHWGLAAQEREKQVVSGLRDNLLERVTKGLGGHLGCGKQKG